MEKVCCFIGHRKIDDIEKVERGTREVIEDLIVNKGVRIFLFGSRSAFNTLCHSIVTEMRERYEGIKRVAYTCQGEGCILEARRKELELQYTIATGEITTFLGVEEEYNHKRKYFSGRASYMERNEAMIDDSDYCVFYYVEGYKPPKRGGHQPSSGTKAAYEYAVRKKKVCIRVATKEKNADI